MRYYLAINRKTGVKYGPFTEDYKLHMELNPATDKYDWQEVTPAPHRAPTPPPRTMQDIVKKKPATLKESKAENKVTTSKKPTARKKRTTRAKTK